MTTLLAGGKPGGDATSAMNPELGPVLVVVPALNEEHYIRSALQSLTQDSDGLDLSLIVMDGGSTDRTRQIVADYSREDPRVFLSDNPGRLQAAALNRAVKNAPDEVTIIIRADCHADYPPRFIEQVARRLREIGCASIVVPMITEGRSCFQRAVAAAQNSLLGNGGSGHRRLGASRFVEHGHHAAFDRASFMSVGGYDESFSHNEDAELDYRIGKAGGKVWLATDLPITYFPRSTARGLATQYYNHGAGRAKTFWKHRPPLKPRQLAPLLILLGTLGCVLLAPLWAFFLLFPTFYAILCFGWGALRAVRQRDLCIAAMGLAAIVMHFAWGTGFLAQSIRSHRSRP